MSPRQFENTLVFHTVMWKKRASFSNICYTTIFGSSSWRIHNAQRKQVKKILLLLDRKNDHEQQQLSEEHYFEICRKLERLIFRDSFMKKVLAALFTASLPKLLIAKNTSFFAQRESEELKNLEFGQMMSAINEKTSVFE